MNKPFVVKTWLSSCSFTIAYYEVLTLKTPLITTKQTPPY